MLLLRSLVTATLFLCANAARKDLNEGDSCTTPDDSNGICMDITKCRFLWDILQKNDRSRTSEETSYLLRSQCGQMGRSPMVCCGYMEAENNNDDDDDDDKSSDEGVESSLPPQNEKENRGSIDCITPNGENGTCMNIRNCGYLQSMLDGPRPISEDIKSFIRNSECSGEDQHGVCCRDMTAAEILPTKNVCGVSSMDNKIFGGEEAAIDEFPWSVMIEYYNDTRLEPLCGGSLISSRYVITAAHCNVVSYFVPSVRLGEHNTTSIVDCQTIQDGEDCNEPLLRVGIEMFVNHPLYESSQSLHDIALIRLEKEVVFTDFVIPICLPVTDITQTYNKTKKLNFVVAGWGVTNETKNKHSEVKMFVDLPYVEFNSCSQSYRRLERHPEADSQVCAGGVKGKDSCKGDSGGPLMYDRGSFYELVGVVSYGPNICGNGMPAVYTKVFPHMDWILSMLKP